VSDAPAIVELESPLTAVQVSTERLFGRRTIRGLYPQREHGRLAKDGSVLDRKAGDYSWASAWLDPACDERMCIRRDVIGMAPPDLWWCRKHGKRYPTGASPYELDPDSDEWIHAEEVAWKYIAPKRGVPSRYRSTAFRTSAKTPAIDAVRLMLDDDDYLSRALVIEGGPGCGKTTACHCFYRHQLIGEAKNGVGSDLTLFLPFPKLVSDLLDSEARALTLERCCDADDLIVDDWGATYVKPEGMVYGLLEEIIIDREADEMPMLIATNLSPKKFRKAFGERIYDRLRGEWGSWINVDAPTLRRKPEPRR